MATHASPETPQQPPASPLAQDPFDHAGGDSAVSRTHSPRTPSTGSLDIPLLPDVSGQPRTPRSHTISPSFISSPLNPNTPAQTYPPSPFVRTRTQSRQSMIFNRVASEESQALSSLPSSLTPNRTSMILYRLAAEDEQHPLSPPIAKRQSVLSNSGESVLTVSYDSKFPSGTHTPHKLIPYPFDPSLHINTPEDDDALHDPSDDTPFKGSSGVPLRGLVNVGVLLFVILALLCLFIFYPVWHFYIQGNGTDQ